MKSAVLPFIFLFIFLKVSLASAKQIPHYHGYSTYSAYKRDRDERVVTSLFIGAAMLSAGTGAKVVYDKLQEQKIKEQKRNQK